jgi:plastocyanin
MRTTVYLLFACSLLGTVAVAEEFQVIVQDFEFIPADLEIEVGDSVTWTNAGGVHNVNAPGFFRCANGCDGEGGNGNPAPNPWSFTRTFNSEAEIAYQCDSHVVLGMVGSLTVRAAGPTLAITSGSCPGPVTLAGANFTPNREVAIVAGANLNGFVKGGAFCNGAVFELGEPFRLPPSFVVADGNGSFSTTIQTVAGRCFVEALDLNGTCETSNPVSTAAGD